MNLDDIVEGVAEIAPLPEISLRVYDMLQDPFFSAVQVGETIRLDPGLTTRVLKVVNSAFYGLARPIETVPHAIAMMGASDLRALVLTAAVSNSLHALAPRGFDLHAFWQHSVFAALAARRLGRECLVENTEPLFVAGLLHDVGRLVLYHEHPELAERIFEGTIEKLDGRWEVEQGLVGFDHAEIGAALLRRWQLPESIWEPVAFHHQPEKAQNQPLAAAVVHIANHVANLAFSEDADRLAPEQRDATVEAVAWSRTGLDAQVIEPVLAEAEGRFGELARVLAEPTQMAAGAA